MPAVDFPILDQLDFFNHAGVAPLSGPAAAAVREYAEQTAARAYVKTGMYRRVEAVRRSAAALLNAAGPHEVAFTPNTSTGLALVANGIAWERGDRVVITDVEYPANRYPWVDAARRHGLELVEVKQRADARIYIEDIVAAIGDRARLVSISHVQFASGHRIDLKPIGEAVHRAGGLLCVDAIQSVGVLPVDVRAMGVDFLSADGHKWMLGPEGAGLFYCRAELCEMLHPAVVGWLNMVDAHNYSSYRYEFQPDARRFEPGSWNVPGLVGLGASLDLLLDVGIDTVWSRVEALTQRFAEGAREKGYRIHSPREHADERSGIVIFEPPSPPPAPEANKAAVNIKRMVADLEKQNIIIVVRGGRLRMSPHFYNTDEQVDRLVAALPG